MKLKNPFRFLFKPKEKPDDPLTRIPKEWKERKQKSEGSSEVQTPQTSKETERKRGRPTKQKANILPPEGQQAPEVKQPQPTRVASKPIFKRRVRMKSYNDVRLKNLFSIGTILRLLALVMLLIMAAFSVASFWTAYTVTTNGWYIILVPVLTSVVLIHYLHITGSPRQPRQVVKFKNEKSLVEWLNQQRITFEIDKEGKENADSGSTS